MVGSYPRSVAFGLSWSSNSFTRTLHPIANCLPDGVEPLTLRERASASQLGRHPAVRVVEAHIFKSRQKLDGGEDQSMIETVRGIGYGFEEEPS